MPIDKSKLTSFDEISPLTVRKYEQMLPYETNQNVVDKLNDVIESLARIGMLNNQVVTQWNAVMKWIRDDSLEEVTERVTNEKLDLALNAGLGLIAENTTSDKIIEMIESGVMVDIVTQSINNGAGSFNILSIPQDYSVTSSKFNELTLDSMTNPTKMFEIELGTMSTTTGLNSVAVTQSRLRTNFILVEKGDRFLFNYPNVNPTILHYNLDKTYKNKFISTGAYTFEEKELIRILFTPSPTDMILTSLIKDIANSCKITNKKFINIIESFGYDFQQNFSKYFTTGKNLFNEKSVDVGYLLANGTFNLAETYRTNKDFIPIKKDLPYALKNARKILLYDQSKNPYEFIDNLDTSDRIITPIKDGFLKVSVTTSTLSKTQVEQNSVVTDTERYNVGFLYPKDQISKLSNKVYLNIGDSISAGGLISENKSYAHLISEKHGMNLHQLGQGGALIATGVPDRTRVIDHLNTAISTGIKPDYIVFNGGTNDASNAIVTNGTITSGYTDALDITTFCGAFEELCRKIKTTFPSSKVLYVRAHNMNTRGDIQKTFGESAEKICEKYSIPVANIYKEGGLNSQIEAMRIYTDSGTHPNLEGLKRFYVPLIESKMLSI